MFDNNHPDLTRVSDHRSAKMIAKAGETIRHHDLAKMTDNQLEQELNYLNTYTCEIHLNLSKRRINLFCERQVPQYPVPTWKIIEDFQLAFDRMEAVVEEINYRIIP